MEEHIQKMTIINDKLKAAEDIKENLFIAMLLYYRSRRIITVDNSRINGLENRPETDLNISLVKDKLIDDVKLITWIKIENKTER